ncbi:hypothetical protein QTP86_031450 [Hemibagrus guttatus]|nr:hypothetical protein QTP86_031450 [Hemibagrus guttatus]
MSGGKKRSGFQITSVTSDVGESPASKIPVTQDVNDPTPLLCDGPRRDSTHSKDQATPSSTVLNGPAFLRTLLTQQSSSQPTTPVTMRKQRSLDQAVTGAGVSRFRVVRLGQGLGEPYKRGRWTCVDVMEREPELHGVRRVMDSMRHAHSLESLETVGLGRPEGEGGVTLKSLKELRAGHMVHLQGSGHLMAHSGPPSPTHTEHETHLLSPPLHTPNTPRTRKIPPPLHLNMNGANRLRATRSQPTSPGPPASQDGLFHTSLTPIQTPSALALAQSMFGVGGAFGLVSDESGILGDSYVLCIELTLLIGGDGVWEENGMKECQCRPITVELFLAMFGSVKKMVSAFETRKQTRPPPPSFSSPCSSSQNPSHNQQSPSFSTMPTPVLKTLPCLSTTPEPHPSQTSRHAPPSCTLSHLVMSERCHDPDEEKQDVVLRRGGEGRRIPRVRLRDSWPIGKLNCFERNFLSFVTLETKEPISCSKCPPEFNRSRLRPIQCKSTSITELNTTSTTGLNTTFTTGLSTSSTKGLNTNSTAGLNTTFTTGLSTSSTKGLNTNSTTGLNATSTTGLNTTSTKGLITTSISGLKATSITGLTTTSTTGLTTTSTTGLKATSTTGLTTTSTTGLNATPTTRQNSTIGSNASSAVSTTDKVTRGTYSRLTRETSSKLTIGANANSWLSLGCNYPVLVAGANKSAFEPPGVPVYPKQVILGNDAAAGTLGGGRGQGKGSAVQHQLGLRPSDTTFFTLLLHLRSGSSNSMIAIDNKIEQAMDLVKAHLMLAVREEVEILREQIKELAERNAQLERENYILRALRENQ